MFETARFEAEQRLPGGLFLGVALAAFGAMMVLIAPGILAEVDVGALLEQYPSGLVDELRLQHMGTLEGFLALELYQFVWLIGLGAYVAYSAASTIAGDVETGRMDTLLAAPISRRRLLLEKYLALQTTVVLFNVVVFVGVAVSTLLIADSLSLVDLAMVHVLSVPFFLACGAFGMLASVVAPGRLVAEGVAAGGIVGVYLIQTAASGSDVSWLGAVSPMRYYDPLAILTASEYDLAGAAILLLAAVVLLLVSGWRFGEVDLQ